jgi:hypothetical protein
MNYNFHHLGRISNDPTDITQRNISNNHFLDYSLSNYYQNHSDSYVKFATNQPSVPFSGIVNGNGLNPSVVDYESLLLLKPEQEREFEKVQLFQRPFATVPYLGKGSCDPTVESRLQQGEMVSGMKSVSTIMEQSFTNYSLYPVDNNMEKRTTDPSYTVEESALNGWVRGGSITR